MAFRTLHDRGVIARWRAHLPVSEATPVISLNEGSTPLIHSPKLSVRVGRGCEVFIKYEGLNPTGSFKDPARCLVFNKQHDGRSRWKEPQTGSRDMRYARKLREEGFTRASDW